MAERPILFSGPMVRALRAGTKTLTRRAFREQPPPGVRVGFVPGRSTTPYGVPGDRLWVRETYYAWGHWTRRHNEKKGREEWHFVDETLGAGLAYRYEAEEKLPRRKRELHQVAWWKRPAIFMPRAASRITLEITEVRVERLQSISEADAQAEGVSELPGQSAEPGAWWTADAAAGARLHGRTPSAGFRLLWESINGAGSWGADPWVWVVGFKLLP